MAFTPAYAAWGGAMLPFPAAEDSFASEFRICYSNPHRITGREWGSVPANSQLFRIRLKCCFLSCSTARRCGLPRRFAPRNDMQKHVAVCMGNDVAPGEFVTLFGFAQSTASRHALPQGEADCHVASPLAMTVGEVPSRPTSVHPQTPGKFLHVIANQCAHWCGNPRPRRETWQGGST